MKNFLIFIVVILFILLSGCIIKSSYSFPGFYSEDYYSKKKTFEIASNQTLPENISICKLSDNENFISGTVSHHSLVNPLIDNYFLYLKENIQISTFIIITPKHFRTSDDAFSTSYKPWFTSLGILKINRKLTDKILKNEPKIILSDYSFQNEHGIGTLAPFIKKYYPKASLVQISIEEKKKQFGIAANLGKTIYDIIKDDKSVFLLISADFSHKENRVNTDMRDNLTYKNLKTYDIKKINSINTDNSTGIYIMFDVCSRFKIKNNLIFSHTDSEKWTGISSNDITSYFFTLQY